MFTTNIEPKYLNAVVICVLPNGQIEGKKYRSIMNTVSKKSRFIEFIREKFAYAKHVNFYNKETKRFYERMQIVK